MPPFTPPLRRWGFPILLLLHIFARLLLTQPYKSPTMDEPHHIARGLLYLGTGRNVWNGNPPLAHLLMAAPLALDEGLVPDTWPDTDDFRQQGQTFLKAVQPRWRAAFFAARLPNMLMALALAAVVGVWARTWFGPRAGAVALLLCAFDPNLLANAQLATTDVPVTLFCTLAGYWAWRWGRTRRWRAATGLGLCAGLALAAKFNAIVVLGLIGLASLLTLWGQWRARLPQAVAAIGLAALVVWAVYRFDVGPVAGLPFPIPAPGYVSELLWQGTTNIEAHRAFLAGQLYQSSVPQYFPLAFLLKTPTVVAIALGAVVVSMARSWSFTSTLFLPSAVFLGYLTIFVFLPLNIGYRHLLPILPFGYVLVGTLFQRNRMARLWHKGAALALMGWAAASSLTAFPYDLAYFAEWSGGAARGYQWLVDSSLDWGQDLHTLAGVLKDETNPVFLSYFGPTDPHALGLSAVPLPNWDRDSAPDFHPANPAPGLYAISATNLQGVLLRDPDALDFFRRRTPERQVGYSILFYRVTQPAPHWVAACETPTFRPTDEELRLLLGPGHRIVHFDCAQSWVVPVAESASGTEATGWYVLPEGMDNAAQRWGGTTELVYHQRGVLNVYAYHQAGFAPVSLRAATFSNTVTLLGASLTAPEQITTVWRVAGSAAPTLSIFGHRVAPDGYVPETADGLGVATAAWRVGDILLQRHTFTSALARDEAFATGVYNWQTGERLLTADGQDRVVFPAATLTGDH